MVTTAGSANRIPAFLDWRNVFPVHLLTQAELVTIEAIRQVAQEKLWPRALRYHQTGAIPTEAYKDLADAGLLGLTIPREFGGRQFTPMAFTVAMIELGQGDPSVANTANMHFVVNWFLGRLATRPQKEYFFDLVVNRGELFAACTSEEGIRWDDPAGTVLTTTIKRLDDTQYVINGRKWRTSMAHTASHYCVAAVLQGYATKEGLVIAMVPRNTPGITIHDDWSGPMMWSTDSCSVTFEHCIVPATHIIGKPGELPNSGDFPRFPLGYAGLYLGNGLAGFFSFLREYGSSEIDSITGNMALRFHRSLVALANAGLAWQMGDKANIPLATAHAKAYCPQVAHEALQIMDTISNGADPYRSRFEDSKGAWYMPPNPNLVAIRVGEALRLSKDPQFLGFRP